MSAAKEINRLINQIYTAELILKAFHARPHTYGDTVLYDSESHTLEVIADNQGITQTQLGELTFRTKGATSIMVDKLIQKGLVSQKRDESNRRRCRLFLTELGRMVNKAHKDYDAAHSERIAALSEMNEEALHETNETLSHLIDVYTQFFRSEFL